MKQQITNFFLNDKIILGFIIANAVIIFAQESGVSMSWLQSFFYSFFKGFKSV